MDNILSNIGRDVSTTFETRHFSLSTVPGSISPLTGPAIPAPAIPAQDSGNARLEYVATFNVKVLYSKNTRYLKSGTYVCYCFDRGSIWALKNGNRDRSLMSLLRSKVQLFSKYKNEDKVSINSTQGEMTFPKPRTTAFILSMVKYQTAFFIEDTGVKQVGDSFHQLGKKWICQADLVHMSTSMPWECPSDVIYILKIENGPSNRPSQQVDIVRVDAGRSSKGAKSLPKFNNDNNIIEDPFKGTDSFPSGILHSERYFALALSHRRALTFCVTCKNHFKSLTENIFHLERQPLCFEAIKSKYPLLATFSKVKNNLFLSLELTPLGFVTPLECQECSLYFESVLTYCLHRDQHKANTPFVCISCTGMFDSPYVFFRHSCLGTVKKIVKHVIGLVPVKSEMRKGIYVALHPTELQILLKCLVCRQSFEYWSQFALHFELSTKCFTDIRDSRSESRAEEQNTFCEQFLRLAPRQVYCFKCNGCFITQYSYLLHMDHHTFADETLAMNCKKCRAIFSSPCSMYRHKCNQPVPVWCLFCDLYQEQDHLMIGSASSLAFEQVNEGLQDVANLWCQDFEPSPALSNETSQILNTTAGDLLVYQETANGVQNGNDLENTTSTKFEASPIWETAECFLKQNVSKTELSIMLQSFKQTKMTCSFKKAEDSSENVKIDFQDFYVCTNCDPFRLLPNSESLSNHLEEEIEHCNINPICYYNCFSLKIKDIYRSSQCVKSHKKKLAIQKSPKFEIKIENCLENTIKHPIFRDIV